MQHYLIKMRLKPGALPKFEAYLKEFEARRAECDESLRGEGTAHESFFRDGDTWYVYKQVRDLAEVRRFQKTSGLKIYDLVERMKADCIESMEELSTLLCFEP